MTRVGVVGHVEWVEFAVVERYPSPGDIVAATEHFTEAAGGGAVAAVQMRKLAGAAALFTVLGDDEVAGRARDELAGRHGLDLHVATRPREQRRGFAHLDGDHERTITTLGPRLVPHAGDDLPWSLTGELDAIYLTGGDPGAVRAARDARYLVATARAFEAVDAADIQLDVLVASATDRNEQVDAARLRPEPKHVVLTHGGEGGTWKGADGKTGKWAAVGPPGPPVDAYGCGDSFAAGLAYGLAAGLGIDGALELASRCGAHCLTGRGPYGAQLTLAD